LWYEKLKEKPEAYMNAKSTNLVRSSVTHTHTHTHIHAHGQKVFQISIGVHPTNQTGLWFRPVMGKLFKEGAKGKEKNFRRANIIY